MILTALAEKLKRRAKDDFKGRHFEPWLIIQAVSWYLRYPLSCRDVESLFAERGFDIDHSTINRWVLAYAPDIEKRLRQFRRPHCGSIRVPGDGRRERLSQGHAQGQGKRRLQARAFHRRGSARAPSPRGTPVSQSAGSECVSDQGWSTQRSSQRCGIVTNGIVT